jgi:hypothetical protein
MRENLAYGLMKRGWEFSILLYKYKIFEPQKTRVSVIASLLLAMTKACDSGSSYIIIYKL